MRHLIAAAIIAGCQSALAFDVGIQLATVHAGSLSESNVRRTMATPGLYVVTDSGLTLGGYRNSLRRTSVYAGWTWRTGTSVGPMRDVSITAAAVTGYSGVKPLLSLSAALGSGPFAPRVIWVPHRTSPVSLAVERRF